MAADGVFGDPQRGHPVAAFGALAKRAERVLYRDGKASGVVHAGVVGGGAVLAGVLVERLGRRGPVAQTLTTALATWVVLGGASLAGQGTAIGAELDAGDLPAARRRLPNLCGRDPSQLDQFGLSRAAVESVAENTSDAVVAPLVWGAIAGVPGLLGYRAINTLDAMVGYRSPHYQRFGWAAARLDDFANLVPARTPSSTGPRPVRGGRGGGTRRPIPARTPGRWRPRSPGLWRSGWEAGFGTRTASRSGPCWVMAGLRMPVTSRGRSSCPGWWARCRAWWRRSWRS